MGDVEINYIDEEGSKNLLKNYIKKNHRKQAYIFLSLLVIAFIFGLGIYFFLLEPKVEENYGFTENNSQVLINTTNGHTLYETAKKVACVQIKGEDFLINSSRIKISFLIGEENYSNYVEKFEIPKPGEIKNYCFNLSLQEQPKKVFVDPIYEAEINYH